MDETNLAELDAAAQRRAQELFDILVSLEPDVRGDRLDRECTDPDVRALVERLLSADDKASEFDTDESNEVSRFFVNEVRRNNPMLAPNARPEQLAIGERLSRFIILHTLGSGGMGIVYAAYDPQLDRRVAIKLLHLDRERPLTRARLQREAMAMARVSHANVVSVYDVGTLDERVFIAMEYVEGRTLSEWMRQKPDWRAIVSMFIDAGRGLQAAHEAGLIHRDFKPENVLVTPEGHAKVTDFGLARAIDSDEHESTVDGSPTKDGGSGLAARLTRAGAVMGTPAYMAPEQFLGDTTNARSDQFSFCVALYHGLWGQLPFAGESFDDIRESVLSAKLSEVPRGHAVPSWLAAVVIRGLAREPAERWSSMTELLQALQDDPRRRRRMVRGIAAGVCLGLITGLGVWYDGQRGLAQCQAEAAEIETEWSPAIAENVSGDLLATGLEFADDTAARATAEIGTWVETWRAARLGACSDARAGVALAEARVRCLDNQRETFAGFVDVLVQVDRSSAIQTMKSVFGLPRPETCLDPAYLANQDKPSPSGLRKQLARVRSLNYASRFAEARDEAMLLLENPALEQSPGLRIQIKLAAGRSERGLGDLGREEALVEEAFYDATRMGHDPLALSTSLALMGNISSQLDMQRARMWARQAEALVERLGSRPNDRARLHEYRGWLGLKSGALLEAELDLRAAVELNAQLHGAEDPAHAYLLADLGSVLVGLDKLDEARVVLSKARQLTVAGFGAEHPDVARREIRLGNLEIQQGNYEAGRPVLERALANLERAYGPEHNIVTVALNSLAILENYAGNYGPALELIERAIQIKVHADGADSISVGGLRGNAASMQAGLGRYEEARTSYEHALKIVEAGLGPDHPHMGQFHKGLGSLLSDLGELEEARTHLERSIVIRATPPARALLGHVQCRLGAVEAGRETLMPVLAAGEPESSSQVGAHLALARCHIEGEAERDTVAALAAVTRALAIADKLPELEPLERAAYLSRAARIELESDRPALALEHARAAHELVTADPEVLVLTRVHTDLELALALAASGHEMDRAEALVTDARTRLQDASLPSSTTRVLLEQLDAWPDLPE